MKPPPSSIPLPIYDTQGNQVEVLQIDPRMFGGRIHRALLKQVLLGYEANARQGTHDTKERGEIAFSKKKPWAQKHTGNARAGTRSSPLWRKGGVVFGPTPRSYRQKLSDGMRRRALQSAILAKLQDQEVKVTTDFDIREPKTRAAARLMGNLRIDRGCLVGTPASDAAVWKSFRNIPRVSVQPVAQWNAHSVIRHRNLLLTKEGFARLLELRGERNE